MSDDISKLLKEEDVKLSTRQEQEQCNSTSDYVALKVGKVATRRTCQTPRLNRGLGGFGKSEEGFGVTWLVQAQRCTGRSYSRLRQEVGEGSANRKERLAISLPTLPSLSRPSPSLFSRLFCHQALLPSLRDMFFRGERTHSRPS